MQDGKILVQINADNRGLSKGIKDSQKKIGGLSNVAAKAGGVFAGMFAAGAIASGVKSAITSIAELESKIKRVSLIAGGSEEAFSNLAKQLGSSTVFTASEAADAMQFLAQAGFKTNEILSATPGVLNLAAAAQMDLGRAADIASNILSGYGIEASRINEVNDILVTTTNNANTNVEQFAEAMKVVAPIAKSAGISLNETSAIIGVLGDAGIQGSLAGTQLKGAISSLLAPSTQAQAVLDKLKVSVIKNKDGSINLTETLNRLKKANLSTADAFTIFGERSAAGALVMANATEKVKELTEATKENGVASKQAAEQLDTLKGDFELLGSAWDGLIQKGGALNGIFRIGVQAVTDLLNGYVGLNGQIRKANDFIDEEIKKNKEANAAKQKSADIQNLVNGGLHVSKEGLDAYLEALKNVSGGEEAAAIIKEKVAKRTQDEIDALVASQAAAAEYAETWARINDIQVDSTTGKFKDLTEAMLEFLQTARDVNEKAAQYTTENIEIQGVSAERMAELAAKKKKLEEGEAKANDVIIQKNKERAAAGLAFDLSRAKSAGDAANIIINTLKSEAMAYAIKWVMRTIPFPANLIAAPIAGIAAGALFSQIPTFAAGVTNFEGGLAQVNERGGEIMHLPSGTDVIPNGIAKTLGGAGTTITVNGFVGNEEELAYQIDRLLSNQSHNYGRI